MNPADGTVIAKNSPDSLRIPASVLKLVSTAAALHFVGAEKTYVTSIHSTDKSNTYVLKGSLDPWLTSNLTLSKKNSQKFLPSLITKANESNSKKITIYYSGMYEKDIDNLAINLKSKKIRGTFKRVESAEAAELAKDEIASLTSPPLGEMVKFVILWSDNTLADRLGKAAARKLGYETNAKGLT